MNIKRWKLLMDDNGTELTDDEIAVGWHFCNDFDGLLVGPGMGEYQICECKGKPKAEISWGQQSVVLHDPNDTINF